MKLAALLLLVPSSLRACAVCFGQTDNAGLVSGLTWGLVMLLVPTFGLIAWLVAAVYKIEKNREAKEARELKNHA